MPEPSSMTITSIGRRLGVWSEQCSDAAILRQADALPLRRDMVTLLEFVRDSCVIGTQSTGNMPLKMVREVTARFVHPPQLEMKLGDRVYQFRSEEDIGALHFLRILAEVGGLLKIARARRWRLAARGEKFIEAAPMFQVSWML